MISDLSRTVLMGHLGDDAQRKNDKAPVTFRLAVTSRWSDNAGDLSPAQRAQHFPFLRRSGGPVLRRSLLSHQGRQPHRS